MAQADIIKHIDQNVLDRIKAVDPHPQFSAFVLGHEGISSGGLIIDNGKPTNVKKKWYEGAIKSLFERLNIGTKVFHLHDEIPGNEGRNPIGEMVGKALEYVQDKLSAIVINYIAPSFRNLGLNVASLEADLMISPDDDGVIVRGVNQVTGIALANSKFNSPGFAGATLLATVQEFALGGEMEITIEGIKEFLTKNRVRPSELFNSEALKTDPMVIHEVREAVAGEYAHRKRTDEAFAKASKDWEEKEKVLNDKIKTQTALALKTTAKEKLEKIMGERKLTSEQIEFIHDEIGDFTVDDPEKLDGELTTRLENGLKKYDRLAKNVFKVAKGNEEDKPVFPPAGNSPDQNDITKTQAYKDLSA